jgi:uncharacterized tellurite resistance protein B-like protein
MFEQLMHFLGADQAPKAPDPRLAVATLLVEAASRSDHFAEHERVMIRSLLGQCFELAPEECTSLLARAEEKQRDLVQLQPYTHAIFEQMTSGERALIIEMLWEVVYADGVLEPEEDALIRKVAGLIYVDDITRTEARRRVVARLGLEQS